jgi:hypothetical protein
MKSAILILLSILATSAYACPDFSGKFKHDTERLLIEQTGCTGLKMTTTDLSNLMAPPTVVEFSTDGQRHPYGPIFVAAAFKGNFLEQLFYGNPTSTELIGDPVHWTVQTDSAGFKNLFVDTVDENDGTLLTEKIYLELTK